MIIEENTLGSQNIEEFEELLKLYQSLKVKCFIEIGSLYGWALRHFIYYSQQKSLGISIDLPVRNFVGAHDHRVLEQERRYKEEWPRWAKEKECKLYLLPTSSLIPSTKQKVDTILNGEKLDFIFIDGDHRYEAIKNDFLTFSPLVRKGGIVAFHDIGLNEEGGGNSFWNEIKTHYKYTEILKDKNKEKGIGVIEL
jgi:cephalosporin hydroxylase